MHCTRSEYIKIVSFGLVCPKRDTLTREITENSHIYSHCLVPTVVVILFTPIRTRREHSNLVINFIVHRETGDFTDVYFFFALLRSTFCLARRDTFTKEMGRETETQRERERETLLPKSVMNFVVCFQRMHNNFLPKRFRLFWRRRTKQM